MTRSVRVRRRCRRGRVRSRIWTSAGTTGRRPRRRRATTFRPTCSPPRSRSTPATPAPRCRSARSPTRGRCRGWWWRSWTPPTRRRWTARSSRCGPTWRRAGSVRRTPWPALAPPARTASARSRTWTSAPTTGRRPRRRPVISCRLMCSPPRSRSTPPMPVPRCRCAASTTRGSCPSSRCASSMPPTTLRWPVALRALPGPNPHGPRRRRQSGRRVHHHPARRRRARSAGWTSVRTSGRRSRHLRAMTCPLTSFSAPVTHQCR